MTTGINALTFKQAKIAILEALEEEGWKVKKHLIIPWADNGTHKLWFKKQALYVSNSNQPYGSARTISYDYDHKKLWEKTNGKSKLISELIKNLITQ